MRELRIRTSASISVLGRAETG
ncbi:hypothetical protein LEMLEM_LOCUS15740 [Lemmus lemmus]